MIAVLFEVIPTQEGRKTYFDLAAQLSPFLNEIDGFISIERFQSLKHPDKSLFVSYFKDAKAVAN